ncbi:MAG TPA: DUF1501 domain-containing protein [Thermoanaerobaculia bacterium]|nr:DUF1501 domain-containing protein [Thermoanaerobaculia bacterium]
MDQSRRDFFKRTGCTALTMAAVNAGLHKFGLMSALAEQSAVTNYRALVCVFMSGGNDSNNMIIPIDPMPPAPLGYNTYSAIRGTAGLAIPQANLHPITPPAIGAQFGLHPSLTNVANLFTQGKVAFVNNVGPLIRPVTRTQYRSGLYHPYQLFSHSDQVAQWQNSRADAKAFVGWGGRIGDFVNPAFNSGSAFPIATSISGQALFAIGQATRPLAIGTGPLNQVLVLSGFTTTPEALARRSSFDYLRTVDNTMDLFSAASSTTQQAIDMSADLAIDPTLTTVFPNTGLGNQLKQVAKLMKLNSTSSSLGLNRQIFFTSIGGFDTHQNEINNQSGLLTQLDNALNAFYNATIELGLQDRVVTFTLSDFSRTLQPSGSGGSCGTDHAWGAHHMVMGGSVLGGNFYGVPLAAASGGNGTVFPTLQLGGPYDTDNRGRLVPTVAVDQYAATLASWLGVQSSDLPTIFPNLGNFSTPNLGFV